MSSNDSKGKRPESVDDLELYQRSDVLMSMDVDDSVFGSGVLGPLDAFVQALRVAYPDRISVTVEHARMKVERAATEAQLLEKLSWAQRWWDQAHPGEAPSTEVGVSDG